MPIKVIVSDQVRQYQATLSPQPRRRVKAAIIVLSDGLGDIKPLQGSLEGLARLRVGEHCIVFRHRGRRIEVFFAAPRSVVYEFLAAHLHELLE